MSCGRKGVVIHILSVPTAQINFLMCLSRKHVITLFYNDNSGVNTDIIV